MSPQISTNNFSLTIQNKDAPKVVLSVPHDGLWDHNLTGHFCERTDGLHGPDRHVWPLANDILVHCSAGGLVVDAVRFLLPRTYVDANRPPPDSQYADKYPGTAYADKSLESYYRYYFEKLGESIGRSKTEHAASKILVLDLHGFQKNRKTGKNTDFDLVLGTKHRTTITVGHPDVLLGRKLQELGYKIFVPKEEDSLAGGDPFSGGYICHHLSEAHGVNVIQIEIESMFRSRQGQKSGQQLARHIADWLLGEYG